MCMPSGASVTTSIFKITIIPANILFLFKVIKAKVPNNYNFVPLYLQTFQKHGKRSPPSTVYCQFLTWEITMNKYCLLLLKVQNKCPYPIFNYLITAALLYNLQFFCGDSVTFFEANQAFVIKTPGPPALQHDLLKLSPTTARSTVWPVTFWVMLMWLKKGTVMTSLSLQGKFILEMCFSFKLSTFLCTVCSSSHINMYLFQKTPFQNLTSRVTSTFYYIFD